MPNSTVRRRGHHRRLPGARWRVATGVAVAIATVAMVAGPVGASTARTGPTGATRLAATTVRTPGAPFVVDGGRLRPASGGELGRLTAGARVQAAPECLVDFDDDGAIALLGGVLDTFVLSPWWNQVCGASWVRVVPANINHYHLTYSDPDVTVCLNASNEYGTPLGAMARGAEECEPIDPVTEPRGFAHSMFAEDILEIGRIDLYGGNYTPRPFTFERIKVVDAPVRVCFQLQPDGPWEAAEPPGPGDHPAQYCWPSLDTGTWDLSAYTSGAIRVSVTSDGDGSPNYGIDNLWLDW